MNAERLFLQSVDLGATDFRYVALAIGAEPLRPPKWAISECVVELDRTARRLRTGMIHEDKIGPTEGPMPDFRYIAIAIGAEPTRPPPWAVWQCILEKDRTARRAATNTVEVHRILDEVVRYLATEQFFRDDHPEEGEKASPELGAAIRAACATLGLRMDFVSGPKSAETDWMKDVKRAWEREQEEGSVDSYHRLFNWKITPRVHEVMDGLVADELGHPRDFQKIFWMLQVEEDQCQADK